MDRLLEIRSYRLKPGTRDRFHQLVVREVVPLLRRWRLDVVAYGPSLHDADSYYLMRAFASLADRERSEDAFYASHDWRQGPRNEILASIESDTTVVIAVGAAELRGLRQMRCETPNVKEMAGRIERAITTDLTDLIELNRKYLRSVETADVQGFKEILADDFLCSLPDGSLVDRACFLERSARAARVPNLTAHDVRLRLMGDVAIVHARTTFTVEDGRLGSGRYTDVWTRRRGRWLAVSAHVTRS